MNSICDEILNLCEVKKLTDGVVLKAIEKEHGRKRTKGSSREIQTNTFVTIDNVRITLLINPKSKTMDKFMAILDGLEKKGKIIFSGNAVGLTKFFDKNMLSRFKR